MAFKLKPDATFPFSVLVPNGDAPLELKLRGRRKAKDDLAAFVASAPQRRDDDLLGEILEGWDDVDTAYSSEALAELLNNYSGAGMAIFRGYLRAHAEAARKN